MPCPSVGRLRATPAVTSSIDAPVSVWSCALDVHEGTRHALTACLPAAERREAEKRPDALERRRFEVARAWRRHVLGCELGCDPAEVPIVVDAGGKPRLGGSEAQRLRFSVSRSRDLALVACSWQMEVGVDVEAIDPRTDIERFAARFLSPTEQRALAARPAAQRRAALFDCWARKEAYLKGIGEGLAIPTASVEVWLGDGRPAAVSGWMIHSLVAPPGFAAAIAGLNPGKWVPSDLHKPNAELFRKMTRDS